MNKLAIISLLILTSFVGFGQNTLQEILNDVERPARQNLRIDIEDDQGNASSIPISILKGPKNGPTFTIISGVHGVEYSSIVAAHELIQEIDTDSLAGNVIIVPISNPSSFYERTPFLNPQDDLNLNRVFPGDEEGTITERIAQYITTDIIAVSDVFIDMHGGDANEDLLSFIGYYDNQQQPRQTEQIKRLAEVSGFEYVVSWPYNITAEEPAKYAFKQAIQDGKMALTIEAGKLGNVQATAVELIKNGIYNMLAEMDLYNKRAKTNLDFIRLNRQVYIKSESKGLFFSDYKAGEHINEGDKIGVIKDEFGEILTELIAPSAGIILYKIGTPPINVGETIMCISYYSE